MSKVLVDRELLLRIAHDDEGMASLADFEELKRVLAAQPAEVEGVRDYLAEFADGEIEARTAIEELQAALSAVTAERDRLREEVERIALENDGHDQRRIRWAEELKQLRAEVEALRTFVTDCTETAGGMVNGNRLSHRAKELIAALAAKEA